LQLALAKQNRLHIGDSEPIKVERHSAGGDGDGDGGTGADCNVGGRIMRTRSTDGDRSGIGDWRGRLDLREAKLFPLKMLIG
jgi:hypothetical protein